MKMSTKGRYALRVMCDLAVGPQNEPIALGDIASRQALSIKYLEQIVTPLVRAGQLKSYRGTQGGYRLTRAPEAYTVKEILEAIERDLAPVACLAPSAPACVRSESCVTLPLWDGLYQLMNAYLKGITLAQLAVGQLPAAHLVWERDLSGGC